MSATKVLICKKCGMKIRVPADAGTVHVTCPKCGNTWDWPTPLFGGPDGSLLGKYRQEQRGCLRLFGFQDRLSSIRSAMLILFGICVGLVADSALHRAPEAPDEPELGVTNVPVVITNVPPLPMKLEAGSTPAPSTNR